MDDGLRGRGIVVMGGTAGMGLSGALALVRAGANVVVVGRKRESVEDAQASLGQGGIAIAGDATEAGVAEDAIALCQERYGRFDGLYHVAGGSGRSAGDGPLHLLSDDGWDLTLDLNLRSLFLSNRAAVRALLDQGRPGSVLNMSSVLGFSPSPRYFSTHAYAAAKSAVLGFTRACAAFYAPQSIRFNVIAPALVETPMSTRAMTNPEILSFVQTKQPLHGGLPSQPEDLDAAVVYLLSEASRMVTGQCLAVDGGWTVSEGQIPSRGTE